MLVFILSLKFWLLTSWLFWFTLYGMHARNILCLYFLGQFCICIFSLLYLYHACNFTVSNLKHQDTNDCVTSTQTSIVCIRRLTYPDHSSDVFTTMAIVSPIETAIQTLVERPGIENFAVSPSNNYKINSWFYNAPLYGTIFWIKINAPSKNSLLMVSYK